MKKEKDSKYRDGEDEIKSIENNIQKTNYLGIVLGILIVLLIIALGAYFLGFL
ncbi:hypothetical protein [Mesonia sp. K4-1]|jgi:hypothetical protein|uniref:hypothetical protein n=1 Tax=Mesonia sp. K4-1 TaxID=2602760 RepID=UPI00164F8A99|nr:hypothetical protein [Mesonia sp. K4-1]